MTTDSRRAWVDVLARMGRETQVHIDERDRHFRITDGVILVISLLMVILAVFNIYYVSVLYKDLNGIVDNMDSMYVRLRDIDQDMQAITGNIVAFEAHMENMGEIHDNMTSLAEIMPAIRENMGEIAREMDSINLNMGHLSQGMSVIDQSVRHMTGGVATMRANVGQIARPMGAMNPFMP